MLVGYSGEFCHAKHHSHFLQEMYILVLLLLFALTKFGTLLLLHRFSYTMNEVSNRAAY